ncbi:MAG: rod shape-determining protein [Synergistaceae bacterium]|nr:rod shape-determining protein [Synergistaceae bacterium]
MFNRDIGIDLGTAVVLVYVRGKGIVLREPSVVAVNQNNKKIIAVGEEAKVTIGRTPGNITAVRPLRDGVIANYTMTKAMLSYFMKRVLTGFEKFARHRLVVGVPSGATDVERRAALEAAIAAGAKEAYLIEEPMAAAIGADLPVAEPTGSMIVDIGGGTTDVAVISLGGIVRGQSLRIAGDKFDADIARYIKKNFHAEIGDQTIEAIKKEIATVEQNVRPDTEKKEVRGRDTISGLPTRLVITSDNVMEAMDDSISQVIRTIKQVFQDTPPELASDILERGILLAGGGAYLTGLPERIKRETGVFAYVADDAIDCVAKGTGRVLESLDFFSKCGAVYSGNSSNYIRY